jgi:hypothetical protein
MFATIKEVTEVVSIIGVLIIAFALWFTVRSIRKQLQLNFYSEYTKRYQEIILNFPESINKECFRFDSLSKDEREKTLRYMRAYFDLCSEEYFLKRQKNLDDATWNEWKTGMQFTFSKSAFRQAWKILRLDTIYYREFTKFVNDTILKNQRD